MPRHSAARPTCTHVVMDRCYGGDAACHLCGRIPSIGFIYACQQDHRAKPSIGAASRIETTSTTNEPLPAIAVTIDDLNPCIIRDIVSGHYSAEQVQKLLLQKQHLMETIQKQLATDAAASHKATPNRESLTHALLAEKLQALDNKVASLAKESKKDKAKHKRKHKISSKSNSAPCDFKCCHTCRPISRDRSFISFETVINGEIKPEKFWNERYMPVANAALLRSAAIHVSPSAACPQTVPDSEGLSDSWTKSDDSAKKELKDQSAAMSKPNTGHKLRVKTAHEDLLQKGREIVARQKADDEAFRNSIRNSLKEFLISDDATSMDDVAVSESPSSDEAGQQDPSPDYEIWKGLMEGLLDKAASVRLPEDDSTESEKSTGKLFAVAEEDHFIEGVALTEEAATTHEPDIVVSV